MTAITVDYYSERVSLSIPDSSSKDEASIIAISSRSDRPVSHMEYIEWYVCVSWNPFLRFQSSIYPKTQIATLAIANILSISRTTAFQIVAGLHYVLFCFRVKPFQFSQS